MPASNIEVLDANKLAAGNEFFKLGAVEHSPDHSIIAYSTDVKGSEYFDIRSEMRAREGGRRDEGVGVIITLHTLY